MAPAAPSALSQPPRLSPPGPFEGASTPTHAVLTKVSVPLGTVYLDLYRNSKFVGKEWFSRLKWDNRWVKAIREFCEGDYDRELRLIRLLSCRQNWVKTVCERGHVVVKPIMCRDRLVCPFCAEKYANDRVKKVLDDFGLLTTKRGAKLYLIHIVFTFPEELWDEVVRDPDKAYRAVYECLNGLRKVMPIWGLDGQIGGVARLHLWSSKEVFKLHPHVHVVVPNRLLKKDGKFRYFVRIRPWFTADNLRARWDLALRKVFGFKCKTEINVFVRYVDVKKNRGKAIHVLRYVFRQFVYDVFRKKMDDDECLDNPEVRDFVFKLLELESSKHLVRYFGYFASNGRKWIYATRKLGDMDESLDDGFIGDDGPRCKVCGARIIKEDIVLWDDIFKLEGGDG